jgi:hypothetical protein
MRGAICCICGARVLDRLWCCRRCQRKYSLDGLATWPEWARFLRTEEERRRRRRDHPIQVIALADLDAASARVIEREWHGDADEL